MKQLKKIECYTDSTPCTTFHHSVSCLETVIMPQSTTANEVTNKQIQSEPLLISVLYDYFPALNVSDCEKSKVTS